jgi:hypothetical protein
MNITISNTLLNAQTALTKNIIKQVVTELVNHYELDEDEAIGHVMDKFSLEVKPKKQKKDKAAAKTEKITKEVISDASNPLIPPPAAEEPKAEAEAEKTKEPKAEKVKEPKVKEPKAEKVKEPKAEKVKEPKAEKAEKVKEPKESKKKIIKQEIIIDTDGQECIRILIPDATHKKNDILNKDKKVIGQYNEEEKIIEYFEEDDELSDIEEEEEE